MRRIKQSSKQEEHCLRCRDEIARFSRAQMSKKSVLSWYYFGVLIRRPNFVFKTYITSYKSFYKKWKKKSKALRNRLSCRHSRDEIARFSSAQILKKGVCYHGINAWFLWRSSLRHGQLFPSAPFTETH